jgi:glycine/sarcosine N-methyltransferase
MATEQNEFYSSISKYYPEIFPYNPAQLKFVESNLVELAGKRILDIGCATGELAFQLAAAGAYITGIDLNEDLLTQATTSKMHPNLTFQKGDMLELQHDFRAGEFDAILCFGNTLVHLPDAGLVGRMLAAVHSILKTRGVFLLQILNYDYILEEQISALPVIETENIKFIRKYIFEQNNPLIRFNTQLVFKKEGEVISNETQLLALRSSDLINLLKKYGFTEVELFAGFGENKFGGNHLPLVSKAKKPS